MLKQFSKFIFALGLMISMTFAYPASAQTAEQFPETSTNLVSRVGSLVISPIATLGKLNTSFFNTISGYMNRCERGLNTGPAMESCLEVTGDTNTFAISSFAEILTNNIKAFVQGKTFVGPASGSGPTNQPVTLVVANTAGNNDSIMVSDLGRFNESGQFAPLDKTTMRGVCAGNGQNGYADGEFYACDIPTNPDTTCPLTATDNRTGNIYPIVNIDGKCWFGTDLEYSELSAGEVSEFQSGQGLSYDTGTAFPLLVNRCTNLLGETPDYISFGDFIEYNNNLNFNAQDYVLTCHGSNDITKKYIHSTQISNNVDPGPFFMSDMAVNDACPSGWHIPTDEEWRETETALGVSNVNSFSDTLYTGEPKDGINEGSGMGSPIARTTSNTTAKLAEMLFDTGTHEYFARDKTVVEGASGNANAEVAAHMLRSIQSGGGNLINFSRIPAYGNMDISFAYNVAPLSWPMRFANLFVNIAHALESQISKAKIRCVQGDAPITQSFSGWGTCTNMDDGNFANGQEGYQQTRTMSCFAGPYQIHNNHCIEKFGTPNLTQSCIPPVGGGNSNFVN